MLLRQASFPSQIKRIDDMAAQVDRLRALQVAIPLRRNEIQKAGSMATRVIAMGGSAAGETATALFRSEHFREDHIHTERGQEVAFSAPRPEDVCADDFEPLARAAGFGSPDLLSERFVWGVNAQLEAIQAGLTAYRYLFLTDVEELKIPAWPADLDFPYLALHGADDVLMEAAYMRVVADGELMIQAATIQALHPDVCVVEARSHYGAPGVADAGPSLT